VLLFVMGFVHAVQAEDPSTPATKPATTDTPPRRQPTKSAPAAAKPAAASTAKKTPAATPPPAPEADDELLEFLGSVDGLEGLEK